MRKILKYVLSIVIITIFIFSIFYMSYEHEYELTKIEEIKTDENYINVIYEKTEEAEEIKDGSILGILTIEKIGLRTTVKD